MWLWSAVYFFWPLMRLWLKGLGSPYVKGVEVTDKASEQVDVSVEILYKVPLSVTKKWKRKHT